MSTNCRLDSPTAVIMPEGTGEPLEALRSGWFRHSATALPPGIRAHATLTKEGAEHATQDGVRERSKEGCEFANGAQDQHDACTILHHAPAAYLPGSQRAGLYITGGVGGLFSGGACGKSWAQMCQGLMQFKVFQRLPGARPRWRPTRGEAWEETCGK